ncbi:TnsA-like heteromeric transposase endonuclease subunit [Streptomyces sp. SID3915]|uniref:TnsA-like heteromeric transposase endonuclease subunit n=1 Tax=Streptomyces sp. SID3915 TaxID=2690263 RepID=UPI001371EC53|nr:TnsA-like heteromeric transposase endonuclease subunit [Streptomyces sp. SID3915]MYX71157.1 TnsA-like heteromeric transposase endonuclease subunit [Streptomyces sp. SID3915]
MSEPVRSGSAGEYVSDVQVGFVGVDGVGRLGSLARCWDEPFERVAPVRRFIAFEGQKNFTGEYWAASSRDLVGYESWVERDAAMALDFDPAVVALASQPFCLSWWDGDRDRQHTPDYFARLADGTGVVVDVRPEGLVDEEAAEVFAFTAEVCATVGWQFRLVGDLDQTFRTNLRWLARYRHLRCHRASVADALREVFAEPQLLFTGADRVGDKYAVLPALYHLLWRNELTADLVSAPLDGGTVVCLVAGRAS